MKTFKNFKLLFVLVFVATIAKTGLAQCRFEMTTESISDIKFEKKCIENYIDSFEPFTTIQILEMVVSENEHGTFLLAKCKIDNEQVWIYIIRIQFINNEASIPDHGLLHSCASENLSLDIFVFKDGKMNGCKKDNHKVSAKQ